MTTADLTAKIFHDEDAARAHFEALRWPHGPVCPHCGTVDNATEKSAAVLARFMRNSPGAEGFLTGLGIKTRDANGNLRDTVQIYTELAGVLKGEILVHNHCYRAGAVGL